MDAYTTALTLLSRRELSTRQLIERLTRRNFPPDEIDTVVRRLTADRTLDDGRVAAAAARLEATVRRRGRHRVLQRVRQLGISEETAREAVDAVFAELDEADLLDRAIARRFRNGVPAGIDRAQMARAVRSLVSQGFDAGRVYARLRALARGASDASSAGGGEGDE